MSLCPGDEVWSVDDQTGALALKRVVGVMHSQTTTLMHLRLGGERLQATVEHRSVGPPFWTRRGWLEAGDLVVGDEVRRSDGAYVEVTGMERQAELAVPVSVYNIEVADWHTYLVGKWQWWVHNTGPCSNLWRVGPYDAMRGIEAGLDAHHVEQKALMSRFLSGMIY